MQDIQSDTNGKLYFAHQYGVTTWLEGDWDNLIVEDVPTNLSHSASLQFDDEGTLWWASRTYGLFSYSPLDVSAEEVENQPINKISVYPNPAVNYVIIDFTTKEIENVNLFIYNNLGQLQSSLKLGKLAAGTFQQQLDIAHFSKGFYTIQLEIGGKVFVERMLVQ